VVRYAIVSVLFALWLTLHWVLAWRGVADTSRSRALALKLLGLLVPGVACWRAWKQNERFLCVAYVLLAVVYLIALLA
jgi:hypothetical protein